MVIILAIILRLLRLWRMRHPFTRVPGTVGLTVTGIRQDRDMHGAPGTGLDRLTLALFGSAPVITVDGTIADIGAAN